MNAVNTDDGFARIFGKGSKERVVPVGRHAISAIRNYLHGGRPYLVKDCTGGELFLSVREGDFQKDDMGTGQRVWPKGGN